MVREDSGVGNNGIIHLREVGVLASTVVVLAVGREEHFTCHEQHRCQAQDSPIFISLLERASADPLASPANCTRDTFASKLDPIKKS